MQYLRELDKLYDVAEIAYDPRLFDVPAILLGEEGLPMVEMPQSLERMSPAFGSLYTAINQGELSHNGDQDYATQVLNAVPRHNERGFTLAKAKSRGKIDAAYALAMMFDRAQHPVKALPPLAIAWA
jgi:phage terminase large subunit-like protein